MKAPFSSEHLPSRAFLASSDSNRFLSAYTSFLFTNIHSSRVHPISTFLACFLSEVIVVFNHATARFGSGRGRPYLRPRFTSPFRSVLIVFHSWSTRHFVIDEVLTVRQRRKRRKMPIPNQAAVPRPCSRSPPFIASSSNLPTCSVGDIASLTRTFIRRPVRPS